MATMATALVRHFIQAYNKRWRIRWEPDRPGGDAEDLVELYRLETPGLAMSQVDALRRRLHAAEALPLEYVAFVSTCGFRELDIPWVSFPSTREPVRSWGFDDSVLGGQVFPFAYEAEGVGAFCFDYRDESSSEQPIVLHRFTSPLGDPWIVGPVFTSFQRMLDLLIEVMEQDVPLHVRDEPSPEQRALFRRLRQLDPEGFGGPGWEEWWKDVLLRGRSLDDD